MNPPASGPALPVYDRQLRPVDQQPARRWHAGLHQCEWQWLPSTTPTTVSASNKTYYLRCGHDFAVDGPQQGGAGRRYWRQRRRLGHPYFLDGCDTSLVFQFERDDSRTRHPAAIAGVVQHYLVNGHLFGGWRRLPGATLIIRRLWSCVRWRAPRPITTATPAAWRPACRSAPPGRAGEPIRILSKLPLTRGS